jgi:hypothetical protein
MKTMSCHASPGVEELMAEQQLFFNDAGKTDSPRRPLIGKHADITTVGTCLR